MTRMVGEDSKDGTAVLVAIEHVRVAADCFARCKVSGYTAVRAHDADDESDVDGATDLSQRHYVAALWGVGGGPIAT